ncbi:hypothetical protein NA63_2371 [Flavobacteriaceae bacterium MAR_2010_105]|nr:hypothetical protein NA63_2371 [Flavobacteriaceae bacterium MAR_2010_105]
MKTFKPTFLIAILLCFSFNFSIAQQRYQVHVDEVKPSMVQEYEKVSKEFVEACKKHKPATSWITAVTSDLKYMSVTPMENFAELDKNPFEAMAKAMGDDFGKLFERFDKCYDSHYSYVLNLSESLTYMPDGISQTQEGKNNRRYYFIHHTPENGRNLYEAIKGVKDLFASKNSKMYYRVYHSGFGSKDAFFLVAISSKDDVDHAQMSKANDELLGEDAGKVFGNMMKYVEKFEEYSGSIRPDLGYSGN